MRTDDSIFRHGFTLIELLLVIMIMGMMGAVAVGAYRGFRRGIAERGVMQSASMFVRGAYERCQIDRVPVIVCFWNETTAEETDDSATRVCGKAVAVRRGGRLSDVQGKFLIDEFGDLETFRYVDEEGEYDDAEALKSVQADNDGGNAGYLYRMSDGTKVERSLVSQITVPYTLTEPLASDGADHDFKPYAYYLVDACGVTWKAGDAYGIPFDEIALPNGFVFGGEGKYSKTPDDPVKGETIFLFEPGRTASQTIQVSQILPQNNGAFRAVEVDKTEAP